MKHPQIQLDAYIIDSLLADLVGHDRRPGAFMVYLFLHRHAFANAPPPRSTPGTVRLSHQAIADATGLSRSAVQSALRHLESRRLIASTRTTPTSVPKHQVLRPWIRK